MNDRYHRRRTERPAAYAAVLAIALAGCATGPRTVRTEVTSFNEFVELPAERSYVFARTLEYQNSLEMKSYESIVRDELAVQGFKLVPDATRAELVVTLRPSVDNTRVVIDRPWGGDPFWSFGGFYGRGYGGFYGSPSFGPYGGGSYGSPFYGGPYGGFYDDVDLYRQRLELDIDSKATTGKRYYEGKVESTSRNGSSTTAMPSLIRALFTDFPGNNGQTRRVDVPVAAN